MGAAEKAPPKITPKTHVVDILGNVIGRDQPIMLVEKAIELVSVLNREVLTAEDTVFFDPFCKAGEILLACALQSCMERTRKNGGLLDLDLVSQELYHSKRYFALSPDERHHRLSLRTFLGNTNSHQEQFNHIIRDGHYLSEIDGRLDKEKFQKEFTAMIEYIKEKSKKQRIVAIGNPPYQENDGGFGGSASAVYNYFVETLMDCRDISEFVVVIPSRWFTTGKGAAKFRDRVLSSTSVKFIRHFKHSKSVFPTVDVLGGVCFFHHDSKYSGPANFSDGTDETAIELSKCDIILDDPRGYDLVRKVQQNWDGKFVSEIAWAVRPFSIRTNYFVQNKPLPDGHKDAVPCFTKRRRILNANIKHIAKNANKIDEWQVAVPSAYAPGSKEGVRRVTLPLSQYFIIPSGHITAETYNVVGSFKTKKEAENFKSFLMTDLARYLLGLRKVTQHVYSGQWQWVPLVDVSRSWNSEQAFSRFKISKEEQKHIQKKLEEWS